MNHADLKQKCPLSALQHTLLCVLDIKSGTSDEQRLIGVV